MYVRRMAQSETAAASAAVLMRYGLIAIILFSSYLCLFNLGGTYFWDDEAEVGVMGARILRQGYPAGWDGRNLYAYRNGSLLDNNLRDITAPLQHYVAAASFRILGISTFTGRLPFALIGIVALLCFCGLVFTEFEDATSRLYAITLFAFSIIFLMNVRQCRYYAPALLGSILCLWAFRRLLAGASWKWGMTGAVGAVLLFYSSFLLCLALLLALITTMLLYYRDSIGKPLLLKFVAVAGMVALVALPYAVAYEIWHRPDIVSNLPWPQRSAAHFWHYWRDANTADYFPWLFTPLVLSFVRSDRRLRDFATLAVLYVLFLAMLTPQPVIDIAYAPVRYLIAGFPLLVLAIASSLSVLHKRAPIMALSLLIITITTNLLTLTGPNAQFKWTLPAFIAEIHRPYPTAYRAAVEYLTAHVAPNEEITATPEVCNYPLLFYVGDRYLFRCLLDDRSAVKSTAGLPKSLWKRSSFPSRVIAFGLHEPDIGLLQFLSRRHEENGQTISYPYNLEATLPVHWDQTQRPELFWHHFGPLPREENGDEYGAVYIFRREPARR